MMDADGQAPDTRSSLERFLGIFTEVKAGEGVPALLLLANVYLLLMSYYLIKPVRDALITGMPGARGDIYKSYMGGAIALALLVAVPAYAKVARRLRRNHLVVGALLFFASHLLIFASATRLAGSESWLPLVFYLWAGIFNLMVVAQFWAFSNDIYSEEQGRRLFPLVGIGASAGAASGGAVSKWLPRQPALAVEDSCTALPAEAGYLGINELLLLSAAILCLCACLTQIVHRRESRRATPSAVVAGSPPSRGAFRLVAKHRYLTLLAAFSLVFTLVNTNGEYMLANLVRRHVLTAVEGCAFEDPFAEQRFRHGMLTSWYGDFYLYVNIVGLLLQAFAVSRLVRWRGIRLTLFVFPVVALVGAGAVLVAPALGVLRIAKIAENSSDYSINNTVRHMLWLPTTQAMKYQAKQAVDTFFVRMGDVSSALLVFVFADWLSFRGVRIFAGANLLLVMGLMVVAAAIVREMKRLRKRRERGELE